MAKQLAKHVTVHDGDGVAHSFGPGDEVPGWASSKITNPGAWAADDARPAIDPPPGPGEANAVTGSEPTTNADTSRKLRERRAADEGDNPSPRPSSRSARSSSATSSDAKSGS